MCFLCGIFFKLETGGKRFVKRTTFSVLWSEDRKIQNTTMPYLILQGAYKKERKKSCRYDGGRVDALIHPSKVSNRKPARLR